MVSVRPNQSLQPSPICSALPRHAAVKRPPVSRFEMPWPYSCAMTPASRSESRSGAPFVPSAADASNGRLALNRLVSSRLIMTDGIVMVGSEPPIAVGAPATLFPTIAKTAPEFCAFLTLTVKLHVPRSINGIEPAGTTKGSHPSVGEAPAPSLTRTTGPTSGPVVTRLSPKPAIGP
jgi:hypothetical protein